MSTLDSIGLKRILTFLLSLLFLTSTSLISAQDKEEVTIAPKMKITTKGSTYPMRLDVLRVDIKVIGQIAVTTFDMTFFNSNPRIMQGEFNFPLTDGQTVTRFALDINGALREGVIIDKEKGRVVFEEIVRQGVDPGLLEKTKGNNFRMRIYPLPAIGSRRVVIAFEQELTDKGMYDLYSLPLKLNEPVKIFSIHAEVIKNEVEIEPSKNTLSNLTFDKINDSYVMDFERNDFIPDKRIALAFPHYRTKNSHVTKDEVFTAFMNDSKDSSYFYTTVRPEQFKEIKLLPKRITLLWDVSNSSDKREIEKEIDLLDAYIHHIGNLTIDLVTFNFKAATPVRFDITNGQWDSLKKNLKSINYDGGTALGCLDLTTYKCDEFLLFSDGITTFGDSKPVLSAKPIYAIHSIASTETSILTSIALESGGTCININKFTKDESLKMLTEGNFHFISAKILSGNLTSVFPSKPCLFNNTFSLAGILCGNSATIKLNFGIGNTITYSKVVQIETKNSMDKNLLRHIWAEKHIAELSLNEKKNKEEINQIGKHYGIVTSGTSLIVLENMFDYVRNNIVPPIEMQKEYFKYTPKDLKKDTAENQVHLNRIISESEIQSKWWNTNYPLVARYPKRSRISVATVQGTDDERGVDIADLEDHQVVIEEKNSVTREKLAEIILNSWDPQTPYAKVLQYASKGDEFNTYLKLKKEYGTTPAFYMDATDFFDNLGKKDTALVILSNLAELEMESPQLLRVLGYKLRDLKRYKEAIMVFREVLKLKGEEPQSYRDLGLALNSIGQHQEAIENLYKVVSTVWRGNFFGIELIAMNEINSILMTHPELNYSFIDKRLIKKEPVDIRVCLSWDTDNCDMDLWVTDPEGEKCMYSHQLTRLGGRMSNDLTNGYGPEEFMIKNAVNGSYTVETNYFGTRSQSMLAPVSLHLVFITNFGKPNQREKEVTIRLDTKEQVINVGKFNYKKI